MDHSEAMKLQAAERYVLGELTAEQRDQYEEHYFTCQQCAADLKTAATWVDNARELMRTEFAASVSVVSAVKRRWFPSWFRPAYAMGAAIVLLAILTYQNVATIPALRKQVARVSAPQALASFSLVNSSSRGSGPSVMQVPSDRPFGIYLDVPPGNFASYVCEIRDEADRLKFSIDVPGEQARETVQLLIPASTLAAGRYILIVSGREPGQPRVGGTEVVRFPFVLQFD